MHIFIAGPGHYPGTWAGEDGVPRDRREAPATRRVVKRRAAPAMDYEALAEFRYQLRKFLAFSETAAREAGLTPQQYQALLAIKGFARPDAISVGDLARFLLVRHHTAVELVDRMTKLRLLDRIADEDDGRRVLVKLTRTGEQKLRTLAKVHFEKLRSTSPSLAAVLRAFQSSRPR
jgi:DNA-binding MarR family transcriptional regulator